MDDKNSPSRNYYMIYTGGATPAKDILPDDSPFGSSLLPFNPEWDAIEKILLSESLNDEVNEESFATATAFLPLLKEAGAIAPEPSRDADGDVLLTWRNGSASTTIIVNSKSIGAIKTNAGRPVFISKKQPFEDPRIDFLWPLIRMMGNPFQNTVSTFWSANSSVKTKKLDDRFSARACLLMMITSSSATTTQKALSSSISETESVRSQFFGPNIVYPV